MPSTYTPNDKLTLQATGENPSTWGQITNTMLGLVDEALDGITTLALSGTTASLPITDGASSNGRKRIILLTGNPGGACTITVTPNTSQKLYFIRNSSTQSAIITQGAGGSVTILQGQSEVVFCDGAGAGATVARAYPLVTDQITEGATNLWYTNARAQAAISGTAPITVTAGVVAIPDASGATRGALTAADWNTFNSKEPAITNGSINLNKLATSGAVSGQVASYNGSAWVPATNPSAPVASVFGRTGVVIAAGGDYNAGQITGLAASATTDTTNATNITSGALALARIAAGGATSGQALVYNGSNWAPGTAGGMKSVQRGTTSILVAGGGTGTASANVTITAVTTSKAWVEVDGYSSAGSGDATCSVSSTLINSTTITINVSVPNVAAGGTVNVSWQVIEFN